MCLISNDHNFRSERIALFDINLSDPLNNLTLLQIQEIKNLNFTDGPINLVGIAMLLLLQIYYLTIFLDLLL